MDTSQYKALFLQETEEHLQEISQDLLQLEKKPDDPVIINNLFRHFHSVKGMAASMGYENLAAFSHQVENILDALRNKRLTANRTIIDAILSGSDTIRAFIKLIAENKPLNLDTTQLVSQITSILTKEEEKSALPFSPPPTVQTATDTGAAVPQKLSLPTIIKVDSKIFDNFMSVVGELFTSGSRLKELASKSYPVEFQDAVHQLGKTIEDLNRSVITARMIPFEDLTRNLPRIVRDMCKMSGKEVELVIQGEDVKLDRAILEHLSDPLVHIIRNAIDHGIESPEERMRLGKDAKGRITLTVVRQRDNIIIEVVDDGRGIDLNKLKEKAVSAGVSKDELERMSEKELFMLICIPGLSLAKDVTETSGRGVGMDIVKGNVESIGGRLEISSHTGRGTKILLELPVTISIIKVLLVSLDTELFALPIAKVLKVLDVERRDIKKEQAGYYFTYNGSRAPVVDLRSVLGIPSSAEDEIVSLVLVEIKDKISGVIVDDFEEEIDAYIKPLSHPLTKMHGILGVTVLGDGRPVFLLDPATLVA